MVARLKFKASYTGIGRMLRAEFMVAAMGLRAQAGKGYAESIAPVYEPGPHPGRYRDSFEATSGVRRVALGSPRAVGTLSNSAPEALWVEVGTRNNPRRRILGKALDVMGGRT